MLTKLLNRVTYFLLFVFPWQTIFIFQQQYIYDSKWEYGTLGMYATEGLAWVCVLLFMLWYIRALKQRYQISEIPFRMSRDRMWIFSVLLFVVYGFVIGLVAMDRLVAFQQAERVLIASLMFLLLYIGPIDTKKALVAFVLGSVPVALLGIGQFIFQGTVASTLLGLSAHIPKTPGASIIESGEIGRWLRAYGSFSHPNVFGGYLVIIIASTLALFRSGLRWRYRFLLEGVLVLQSAALFCSFSRSAWISLVLVVCVYVLCARYDKGLWAKQKKYLPVLSVVLTFVAFGVMCSSLVHTRFAGDSSHEVASIVERASGYHDAWQLFQGNWLLGVGGGNYTRGLLHLYPDMPGWWYQPVHNVFALFVVEYGVLGVALLLFVFVSFFRMQNTDFRFQNGIFVLAIVPLLFLDHYLWSSWSGLLLISSVAGMYCKIQKNEVLASQGINKNAVE